MNEINRYLRKAQALQNRLENALTKVGFTLEKNPLDYFFSHYLHLSVD